MDAPYTERYVRCGGRGKRLKDCQLYPILCGSVMKGKVVISVC